jgi:hypothetical protein
LGTKQPELSWFPHIKAPEASVSGAFCIAFTRVAAFQPGDFRRCCGSIVFLGMSVDADRKLSHFLV